MDQYLNLYSFNENPRVSQMKTLNMFHLVIYWTQKVELSWNLMAHGDAREGKWRGSRRVEWVASSLSLYLRTWCIQYY